MSIEFEKKFGPGKCSKCGIYIESDVQMYVAKNLTGRPSLVKDQLVFVDPEFCEICYEKISGR
tara:strand:- start:42 stop:230 length:189 start_codon:yes stop_codon:yes gene_type:complete